MKATVSTLTGMIEFLENVQTRVNDYFHLLVSNPNYSKFLESGEYKVLGNAGKVPQGYI